MMAMLAALAHEENENLQPAWEPGRVINGEAHAAFERIHTEYDAFVATYNQLLIYERWAIWQRMSLYSQTIVNNCVNDRRRVVGTLVGVVGCTALIVVAVTLYGNVAQSLVAHYENVYSFDSIVYLDESSQEKVDEAAKVLYDRGMSSAPVYTTSMIIRKPDGSQATATMMIPTSLEAFDQERNPLWVAKFTTVDKYFFF